MSDINSEDVNEISKEQIVERLNKAKRGPIGFGFTHPTIVIPMVVTKGTRASIYKQIQENYEIHLREGENGALRDLITFKCPCKNMKEFADRASFMNTEMVTSHITICPVCSEKRVELNGCGDFHCPNCAVFGLIDKGNPLRVDMDALKEGH